MEKIYKRIQSISHKDVADAKGLTLKSMEELGELVQALLWENGYKKTDKTAEQIRDNQLEEACDVIICMLGALEKLGFTYEQIETMINKKCNKWDSIAENRQWLLTN